MPTAQWRARFDHLASHIAKLLELPWGCASHHRNPGVRNFVSSVWKQLSAEEKGLLDSDVEGALTRFPVDQLRLWWRSGGVVPEVAASSSNGIGGTAEVLPGKSNPRLRERMKECFQVNNPDAVKELMASRPGMKQREARNVLFEKLPKEALEFYRRAALAVFFLRLFFF